MSVSDAGKDARPSLSGFWHDLPREGKLLLSVVVFEFVGTGLVLPFWVVYLHEVRGFSLGTSGLLLGIQPLLGLVAAVPGGAIIDRFGARVVLIAALCSTVAGEVVMAFAHSVPLAALALGLSGMAFGVSFPASQTMIATIVPSAIRQRYFGVNFSLLNLGIGLGGLVGGAFVDVERLWTFQALYLGDALTFLPSLFLLLVPLRHVSGKPAHEPEAGEAAPSYREVLRLPAMKTLVLLSFVVSFVAYAQLNSGMPAFARAIGEVSTQGLGIAFAANTAVIVLLQLVVLQRIEGHRRTRVMVVMSLLWAASWLLLGASGQVRGTVGATILVAACASVFALGETMLQPTMPAITNDLATDRLRGRTNALGSISFQVPSVIAPPTAGWLIGHDLPALYIALLLVGCGVVIWLAVWRLEPQLSQAANGLVPVGPPVRGVVETSPVHPTPVGEP